jgi:chemotaxis signal transduction protein
VANVSLALPAAAVLGVHDPVDLVPLPGLGLPVRGLGTVLGRATTIIDLEPVLASRGEGSRETGADPVLILLAEPFLGLALQVASEVTTGPLGTPSQPPAGAVGRLSSRGFREDDGNVVGILEPERIIQVLAAGGTVPPAGSRETVLP